MNENLISGVLLSQTTSVLTTHFGFVPLTLGVDNKNRNSLKLTKCFLFLFSDQPNWLRRPQRCPPSVSSRLVDQTHLSIYHLLSRTSKSSTPPSTYWKKSMVNWIIPYCYLLFSVFFFSQLENEQLIWRKQILRTHLVDLTFSENGSNVTLILLTPFKFTCFSCFPIADTTPPDLFKAPLKLIDILLLSRFYVISNNLVSAKRLSQLEVHLLFIRLWNVKSTSGFA